MSRELIGRVLCFGLGALYSAGLVPLFTFGPRGQYLWSLIEAQVAEIGSVFGVAPWIATTLLGLFAVGGPLALVWLIAGRRVSRLYWTVIGAAAYGAYWMFAP